jgi:hypothetical protein
MGETGERSKRVERGERGEGSERGARCERREDVRGERIDVGDRRQSGVKVTQIDVPLPNQPI